MARIVAVELSRRSFYLTVGSFELAGERRTADWPAQWSYLREAGSLEIWGGRTYLCVARKRPSIATVTGAAAEGTSDRAKGEVLPFKRPVRAA